MTEQSDVRETYERQLYRYERRIYPLFVEALQKQLLPVLDYIRTMQDVNPPLNLLVQPEVFIKPMQQAYETVGQLSAKRQYYLMRAEEPTKASAIGFLIDLWSKIFYDYSTEYAYRIMNELSETTREEIRTALTYSFEQGYSADQTAAYIRKRVGREITRYRANMIARTEAGSAAALGKITGGKSWLEQQNQKGYKQYIGREDIRERESHRRLNDTIIPIDEDFAFTQDGQTEYAPHPCAVTLSGGERINCRCSFLIMSERRYNQMIEDSRKQLGKQDLLCLGL